MKDEPHAGVVVGDAFRFYRWADAVAETTDLTATQKLVAHALARFANAKTGRCCPGRDTLAAAIGTTRLKTISEATAALEQAGWLKIEHGRGNRASYVLRQKGVTADFQTGATADQVGRQAGLPDGRQAGHPTGTTKRNYEGKEGAPVGARPLSPSDDPATDRAAAIVAAHSDLVAAHTKVRPRPASPEDHEAAVDLADRLDAVDWRVQVDLALRVGLGAAKPYMRGQVVTIAGLARHFDELTAKAERAETGPPPAGWDAADDEVPWWASYDRDREFERVFARLPADSVGWTSDEASDWALDRCDEDERLETYGQEFWEALERRLGLGASAAAADAEAVPAALPAVAGVVEPAMKEPDAEVADEPRVDGAEFAAR